MTGEATVLIVPGLRDHVPQHWQTLVASRLPRVRTVPAMGRDNLDRAARVAAIEEAAATIEGPLVTRQSKRLLARQFRGCRYQKSYPDGQRPSSRIDFGLGGPCPEIFRGAACVVAQLAGSTRS